MTTTILAAGRPLTLLAEKAAFLAASRTLLVADAHIGKAVSFRALGVPVPRGTTSETLAALSALIATWRARRIVFLGDFLHSARAHAPATLGARRALAARARVARARPRSRQPRRPRRRPAALPRHARRRRAVRARRLRAVPSPAPAPRRLRARRPPASLRQPRRARASTICACRASGSATTSACCPRSAPSPACTRSAPAPSDRVFAIADGAVAAVRSRALSPTRRSPRRLGPRMAFDPAPSLRARRARRGARRPPRRRAAASARPRPTGTRRPRFAIARAAAAAAGSSRCATSRAIRLAVAGRGRCAEGAHRPQHRAVRRRQGGQQRAADGRARHRQELADQGLPERVRAAAGCA